MGLRHNQWIDSKFANIVTIKGKCTWVPNCNEIQSVQLDREGLANWLNGMLIQDAIKESVYVRDFLLSGLCFRHQKIMEKEYDNAVIEIANT